MPKIKPLKDGPLQVNEDTKILNSNRVEISVNQQAFLCRCGQSDKKPYCDGTHNKCGFSDKNLSSNNSKIFTYEGKEITVFYNKKLCTHAGACVGHLPNVFDTDKEPWCNPDAEMDVDFIEMTIRRCPSGALSYKKNNQVIQRDWDAKESLLKISKNGPIYIEGSIELEDAQIDPEASTEHYALCRCGKSANMPFCDGCHTRIKFKAD